MLDFGGGEIGVRVTGGVEHAEQGLIVGDKLKALGLPVKIGCSILDVGVNPHQLD